MSDRNRDPQHAHIVRDEAGNEIGRKYSLRVYTHAIVSDGVVMYWSQSIKHAERKLVRLNRPSSGVRISLAIKRIATVERH